MCYNTCGDCNDSDLQDNESCRRTETACEIGGRRRRNQIAARVTVIKKYLGFFPTRQDALNALANYNRNLFDVDLRKLTFAEVWERRCKQKFKSAPVKPVYVAAYKNLAPLHEMIFSRIRKRHIQAVIEDCPLKVQANFKSSPAKNLPHFGAAFGRNLQTLFDLIGFPKRID